MPSLSPKKTPVALPSRKPRGWLASVFPGSADRILARRYLIRPRRNRWLALAAVLWTLLVLGIEAYQFLLPGPKPLVVSFLAIGTPLVAMVLVMLNGLSVFSTVAIAGVVMGVAALTVVVGVTSGFQREIRTRVIGLNAHLMILKYGLDFTDYLETLKRLEQHPEVAAAEPFVYHEMLLSKEGYRTAGVLVKGIDVQRASAVLELDKWLRPLADGTRPSIASLQIDQAPLDGGPALPGVFVGRELARRLRLKPGDRVRLLSPLVGLDWSGSGAPVQRQGDPPKMQDFRIAGVFSAGFDEYDRRVILVALPKAQDLVGMGNTVTGIELRLHAVERSRILGAELVEHLGGPPFRSIDWEELNHNLFTALAMQKGVLSIVLFGITLVAAVNIIASLTMLVIEKTREVAILKAMGLSSYSVALVFSMVGLAIGSVGTSLGVGMGLLTGALIQRLSYLLDAKVYMIERLPTRIAPSDVMLIIGATLLISWGATLYPALRAAWLRPADGLRED